MGCSISKRAKVEISPHSEPTRAPISQSAVVSKPSETGNSSDDDFVEEIVCKESDLKENELKTFPIWEEKVLLVKQGGKISALGTKCTHYGAPLEKSALGDGRLRCQWHGACFNIANGDIEDFPGLDSLPCYKVTIEDGNVKVKADKKSLKSQKRAPLISKRDHNSDSTFIVVGGGPAGLSCVQTLRDGGFVGRLVFVIGEPQLPYDRIKLSKDLSVDANKILLRPLEFYKERDIEVLLETQITSLSPQEKSITLSNNNTLNYDKIFLATGSSARRIPAPGSDLENIFVLRTVEDAHNINTKLTATSNVVVLGSSFIGLEAASAMVGKVASVTVVAIEAIPFGLALGNQVGARVKALFEEKGVKFCLEQGIQEYLSDEEGKAVKNVLLTKGETIPADIVIQGVGVVSNTKYLTGTGLELRPNGSVPVNDFLQTSLDGVFVGGDIAHAPVLEWDAAIGHWGLATYHGRVAALNMLGKVEKLDTIPFFWTMLFGKGFRYCGFAPGFKSVEIRGDLEALTFVAFYVLESNKIGAVLTCGRDPIAAAFGERLKQKLPLEVSGIDEWLATF